MKEIILPCKCHKINSNGELYSRIYQFSKKGLMGIQTRIGKKWKKLKLTKNPRSGYLQTILHGRMVRINRLIAINFISNPFVYPEAQHINGIRTDNRIENLKWGNQKDNALDREKHGNTQRGSKNKNSKLKEKEIREIRKIRETGKSLNQIARHFKVSKKLILLIIQGKIWKHVI